MSTIGAYDAKTNFSQLLERVTRGETITITKHGVPVAILAAPEASKPGQGHATADLALPKILKARKRFRLKRIRRILDQKGMVELTPGPKVIVHFQPVDQLDADDKIKFSDLLERDIIPLGGNDLSKRYNFEGYTVSSRGQYREPYTYLHIFRSGAIETVATRQFSSNHMIPWNLEHKIINVVERCRNLSQQLSLEPPFLVSLTFAEVKDYFIPLKHGSASEPIKRDLLIFPSIIVNDFETKIDAAFQPVFDILWQACGLECCYHYAGDQWRAPTEAWDATE